MDPQATTKKIQEIINRFLSKLAIIEKKKMYIIKEEKQKEDSDAVAQAQAKIKTL